MPLNCTSPVPKRPVLKYKRLKGSFLRACEAEVPIFGFGWFGVQGSFLLQGIGGIIIDLFCMESILAGCG